MTRDGQSLLEIDQLTVGFPSPNGWVHVVSEVSLTIARGEVLALVGESGCGKTMTALALLRLTPPPGRILGGSVRFEGRELTTLSEPEMQLVRGARIGLIFQEPMSALNPVLTIGRHIEETLRVHGMTVPDPRTRAVELLTEAAVDDPARRLDQYAHQLSGGLRQRALIALALACRPVLLIADEPTTALDVTIQAEILDLLAQLRKKHGLALLLISHDPDVVAHTADRVAVMQAGRIIEEAPVRTLFEAPQHPYTVDLMRAGRLGGRVTG
ncbi:MAG: ATP-binding cassette domain-containing protein [Luteitalea sp.]|nr:ATP-binding cassette domain-containing protein [Luteitalea sp.]